MYEYTCTTSRQKKTAGDNTKTATFFFNFVATKIKIEIEIEISSFCQDCRKDQDCLLLGNILKELIGTFFRRQSPSLLS